jgi:hypothetical protein
LQLWDVKKIYLINGAFMDTLKKNIIIVGIISSFVATTAALAGTETPRVDQRQISQEHRFQQGIGSGRLTQFEANSLEAQQNRIDNAESRMKGDGVVTQNERLRLAHLQNKASRHIYRKKHNLRNR